MALLLRTHVNYKGLEKKVNYKDSLRISCVHAKAYKIDSSSISDTSEKANSFTSSSRPPNGRTYSIKLTNFSHNHCTCIIDFHTHSPPQKLITGYPVRLKKIRTMQDAKLMNSRKPTHENVKNSSLKVLQWL